MKATAILIVDRVEPSRGFFVDRLGFETVMDLPRGDQIGFTLLKGGDAEVMLQSKPSLADDLPVLGGDQFHSIVYIDVADVRALAGDLGDAEIVVPLRTTPYGATEVFVREPGGNVVGLASPTDESPT